MSEFSFRDRVISSFFAYPWLMMIVPVMINLIRSFDVWEARLTFFAMLGFVITYMLSWWVLPGMPISWEYPRRWLLVFGTAIGFEMLVWYGSWNYGGAAYMSMYLLSMAAFLSPRAWCLPTTLLMVAIGILQAFVPRLPDSGITNFTLIGLLCGTIVIFAARFANYVSEEKERLAVVDIQRQQVAQRERISADLHDVLGQQLTAIAVHSQLAQKQLNRGHFPQAQATLEIITGLSREALVDVRGVVGQLRQLDLGEELRLARATLEAQGIAMGDCEVPDWSPEFKNFAAWVVREGCTNVVHHAVKATRVSIVMSMAGIAVIDNGRSSVNEVLNGDSVSGGSAGNGIVGLANRGANIAEVWAGQLADAPTRWREALERVGVPAAVRNGFCLLALSNN